MAAQTNKSGTQLIIKKSVLEELILSSARLQNAIASVIEGAVSQPMSASAIKMQRAEEAELEGEVLVEEEVETDAEVKKNTENAKKASEGRSRTAVAKRAKTKVAIVQDKAVIVAPVEEAKVEVAPLVEPQQIKVDEIAAQVEAPVVEAPVVEAPVVEAPTMTEEEAMGQLRNVGMQLFKQDKELFLKIQSSFNVKALAQLPLEGKLDAIKALEEALK